MLGSVDIVKFFLTWDFVDHKDMCGRNALLSAIHNQWSTDVIIAMLDGGFPIESQTSYGRTALHAAIEKYRITEGDADRKHAKGIVQLLISRGANLDTIHQGGHTALDGVEDQGEKREFIIRFYKKTESDAFKDIESEPKSRNLNLTLDRTAVQLYHESMQDSQTPIRWQDIRTALERRPYDTSKIHEGVDMSNYDFTRGEREKINQLENIEECLRWAAWVKHLINYERKT